MQVRTQLQHSWATAVEAVGLFRGEDLKGGHGDPNWLRLFKLMSAEFAESEGCELPPNVPSHSERVAELKDLDVHLGASSVLDGMGYGGNWFRMAVHPDSKPKYYLIKLDTVSKQVFVEPHFKAQKAVESYNNAESSDNESGEEKTNVVLVEADKIENLTVAYPNYFGDVQFFKRQLSEIVGRKEPSLFDLILQETVPPPPKEKSNWGWWFNKKSRQWK